MVKAHTPINWENEPSYNTPLNAANLNKMDSEIGILDDRIIEQDTIKLDKATANTMVKAISFDENTGVFTITLLNGSTTTIDTKLEKVVVNFDYDANTQQIILNLVDGTTQYIDLSALITQYEFVDSNTIGWEVTTDGKVKAKILDGSITENMLQPNYLAEIKVETEKSAQSMANAKISENNAKQSELNAKASEEKALEYSNNAKHLAQSVTGDDPTITNSTDGNVIYLKNSGYTEQYSTAGNNLLAYNNVYRSFTAGQTFEQFVIVRNPFSKGAGTYNYSCSGDFGGAYNYGLWVYDKDNNLLLNISNIGVIGRAIEITEDVANNTVRVDVVVGGLVVGTAYSGYIYPQISYGETRLDYEPYTNGASPNPDYPQHIDGLGDKGYFDGALTQGYRGASDGVYAWDNRHITNSNGIECKSGDIIKIKYEEIPERLNLVFYDKDNIHISGSYKDNVNEYEVTAPENAKYVYFTIKQENITPSTAKHICVTINGMYAVRVKTCGKNLCNSSWLMGNWDNQSLTYQVRTASYLPIKPNTTYTLSCASGYSLSCKLHEYSLDHTVNVGVFGASGNNKLTITTPSNAHYMLVNIYEVNQNTMTINDSFNFQLEEGNKATDYEPYTETQELIPVSSPLYDGDYIEVYADGSGQIVRETRKVDCNDNWFDDGHTSEGYRYSLRISHKGLNSPLYSTHYKQLNASAYNVVGDYIENRETTTKISVRTTNTELSNVTNFKAWLLENDVYILIKLATPTTEPLTAEQVQAFKQLQTFKGVTHINADGEVTVRYYCNNDSGETVGMLHEMVEDTQNQIDTKLNGIFKIVEVGTVLGSMQPGAILKDLYIDINRFIEGGYLPISISGYNVDKSDVNLYRLELNTTEGKIYFSLYNTSSEFALASVSLDTKVLLVKEEFFAN